MIVKKVVALFMSIANVCLVVSCMYAENISASPGLLKNLYQSKAIEQQERQKKEAGTKLTSFSIEPLEHEPLTYHFSYNKQDKELAYYAEKLSDDLAFSGQLQRATCEDTDLDFAKKNKDSSLFLDVKKYAKEKQGPLSLYVALRAQGSDAYLLRKKYTISRYHKNAALHKIASDILTILTGQPGPLLYTLTYNKRISQNKKVICIADYVGSGEKVVTHYEGICTAPVWHTKKPVLLYSRFTHKNGELRGINIAKNKDALILAPDGLCLQPAFSPDGKDGIVCSSLSGSSQLYKFELGKSNADNTLEPLAHNTGNNSKPCYLPGGDVVFCSDFETGSPQLYYFQKKTGKSLRLTTGKGYCAAPAYSPKHNKIVYVRYTQEHFQLFTLHLGVFLAHPEKEPGFFERQLTHNAGDKHEPSWSPCGDYILCACDFHEGGYKQSRQIAVLNTFTQQMKIVTDSKEDKSFPSWTAQTLYRS